MAQGVDRRTIAARLDRPPGTVRGWLRAFARRTQPLSCCGVSWTVTPGDGDGLLTSRPVRLWVRRCAPGAGLHGAGLGAALRPQPRAAVIPNRRAHRWAGARLPGPAAPLLTLAAWAIGSLPANTTNPPSLLHLGGASGRTPGLSPSEARAREYSDLDSPTAATPGEPATRRRRHHHPGPEGKRTQARRGRPPRYVNSCCAPALVCPQPR